MRQRGGRVAIFDGTNATQERRRVLLARCHSEGLRVMFIESIVLDSGTSTV